MVLKIIINFKESLLGQYTKTLNELMQKKVAIALVLMVVISLSEGISLLLLVPLLQLVGLDVGQGSLGQIAGITSAFFTTIGLQPTLLVVLLIYVLVISFIAILSRLQTLRTSKIQYQFAAKLRKRLYNAITNSNWLFFTKMKSSNFAHAITNEIERISMGTGQFLTFIASIMILIVYIIFALKIAGIITGIIFIVGIAILLILRRRTLKSRSSGEDITSATRNLYSSIIQHLDGMKTIKSFGMQEENISLFSNQTNNVAQNYQDTIKSYADVKLLFDIGTVIVLAILVLFLIEIIKLPTATLFLLIYLFVRMIPQFSTIQRSYQYFINMLPAFGNVIHLEKQCLMNSDILDDKNCQIKLNKVIKLENISFTYLEEEQFFIKDLNLEIPVGKSIAIVGSSGAGKSTIADLIMGLIQPNEGKITIDGISISKCLNEWRSKIGYVSQETFLFNETIKFNLLLSQPEAKEEDIIESLKHAAANKFVSKLPDGINTIIGDRGVKLSGGERQRLALARALLRNPHLLILDEATSNLDTNNEKKILTAIDDLHGEITILIIAHRLSTIKNADYIYLIDEGQILESGTWEELLKNKKGYFWDIYEAQGLKL
ncbi:ABC transporter ATP-binding protein [Methanobacterium spitsbergense]|uniref:ABC transporter ATP-binding protein/permease n=1 Tax=Methanobacterium spitsbergense TaxID=2874285 RepID=A0A8T5URC9_9EURY|nr:ABC transporter ATP-binding protein [Methanobacterium spitsbergense]MBZ2166318.1 ABC transporter ATP-binding protein/permease [Methanobacterium spitsbergense]